MKKYQFFSRTSLVLALTLISSKSQADLWGADVAVLVKILAEQVKQYYQLKTLIGFGKSELELLRSVNAGINNSVELLDTLPIKDEKILADIQSFKAAMGIVESIYGKIPRSSEGQLHLIHDQTVAESLKMANSFKEYSTLQERNSEVLAAQARLASPKGAARMQAVASAEILNSLSQLIRLNTQMLKLESEQLAMTNLSSKSGVANFQKVNTDLGRGFTGLKLDMNLGRFQ